MADLDSVRARCLTVSALCPLLGRFDSSSPAARPRFFCVRLSSLVQVKGNVFKNKRVLMEHIFKAKAEQLREKALQQAAELRRDKARAKKSKKVEKVAEKENKRSEEISKAQEKASKQ